MTLDCRSSQISFEEFLRAVLSARRLFVAFESRIESRHAGKLGAAH